MSTLTLISHPLCPYVQRAAIALTEKEIPFQRVDVDLSNKPRWFEAISPLGKVPLLKIGDDVIFESAVIVEYVEETAPRPMHPADPLARARHRAWIEFASATLNGIGRFYAAPDFDLLEAARRDLSSQFGWLERHLGDGPYFEGERFHLVDAAFGPVFRYFDVFDQIRGFGVFDGLPRTKAYRADLAARESVKRAVADDYPQLLWEFLSGRGSALSRMMGDEAA